MISNRVIKSGPFNTMLNNNLYAQKGQTCNTTEKIKAQTNKKT